MADGRGLERRVKHGHTEADHDEVSLVVVRVELEHKVADDGVGEGEVELEVAVKGGSGDKAGVSRVNSSLILAENGEVCVGESRKYLRLTLASGSRFGMVDWDGLESCKVFTEAKIEGSTGSSSSFAYSI